MLYAMFALVVFTYSYMLLNFVWRFTAVKKREMSIKYFRKLDGQEAPEHILLGSRHMTNLFEMPVLFYVAGTLAVCLHLETLAMVVCAWCYVAVRVLHAYIHTTYNNVVHRMLAFHLSSIILFVIWVLVVLGYRTSQ